MFFDVHYSIGQIWLIKSKKHTCLSVHGRQVYFAINKMIQFLLLYAMLAVTLYQNSPLTIFMTSDSGSIS